MKICFVRHGQTDWNIHTLLQGRSNIPLNELGKKQAAAVGNYLKENDPEWDVIVSSPLSRAIETAWIIAKAIKYQKEIIISDAVIERSFGDLEGKPLNQEMYDTLEKGGHQIEEESELKRRARLAMLSLYEKYPNEKVLVCSHAQFIKAAIIAGDPTFNFRSLLYNSSMNYLEVEQGEIRINRLNVTAPQ